MVKRYEVRKWLWKLDRRNGVFDPDRYLGPEHYDNENEWKQVMLNYYMTGYTLYAQDDTQLTLSRDEDDSRFIVTFHIEGY